MTQERQIGQYSYRPGDLCWQISDGHRWLDVDEQTHYLLGHIDEQGKRIAELEAENKELDAESCERNNANAVLDLRIAELEGELIEARAETEKRVERCQQWYGVRFQRLRKWVADLPEEKIHEYFSIVANGTADPWEPPAYDQQLNLAKHRIAKLEAGNKRKDDFIAEINTALSFGEKPDHQCEALSIVVAANVLLLRFSGDLPDVALQEKTE